MLQLESDIQEKTRAFMDQDQRDYYLREQMKAIREELGEELIVSRSIRGQMLKVFSVEGWNAYIAPIKQQERRVAEPALRYLHRNAVKLTPDSQGRILLPQALLDFAQIDKNAVVVGNCDCVEIWSEVLYQEEIEAEDRDGLRAQLELFGL